MNNIELFCSDLDGTLLGNPEATRRFKIAWEELPRSSRPLLCYASGHLVQDVIDVLATRILQRQAESRDASEATLDVLAEQKRFAHPLDEEERAIAVQVDNTDPDSMRALPDRLNALCRGR